MAIFTHVEKVLLHVMRNHQPRHPREGGEPGHREMKSKGLFKTIMKTLFLLDPRFRGDDEREVGDDERGAGDDEREVGDDEREVGDDEREKQKS